MPLAYAPPSPALPATDADPLLMAGYAARAPWRPGFDAADYRAAIRRGNDEPIPRPIAVVLRMPGVACPVAVDDESGEAAGWLPCLEREIVLYAGSFAPDRRLVRILIEDPEQRLEPSQRRRLVDLAVRHLRGQPRPAPVPFGQLDVVGIGPGAIGRIECFVARNLADVTAYCDAVGRSELPIAAGCRLGPEALALGDLVATLIAEGGVDLDRLGAEHGLAIARRLGPAIARLSPSLVRRDGTRLTLTAQGRADPGSALEPLLTTEQAMPAVAREASGRDAKRVH